MATMMAACDPTPQQCLDFLFESMPLPDMLVHDRDYWEANVNKTLEVRDRMLWDIPDREFYHFVLPLRVNNENLDDFRTTYADELCDRVEGMTMEQAALEINHWCHERATYVPSDGRTLGPMSLINSGLGRCGEESVLAVAALRAAGIPARQVYTPRWAHTDDNHAWVEVFVNGKWHFMGACEPEPVLDLAWFNSSVSRAMLLHTRVFGNYDGPEDIISRNPVFTEINCIKSYIPTRRTTVQILDSLGNAVKDATVQFKIYNYAEFHTVASYKSDASGYASLDTGLGDIVIWASDGRLFGMGVAGNELCKVVLDKELGKQYSFDLDVVPPAENALPSKATAEQIEKNAKRLEEENKMRQAMPHHRIHAPELFLSAKDAIDVTQKVVDDAEVNGLTGDRYIDCPRVELEMLYPCREKMRSANLDFSSASDVASWVKKNISIDGKRNPQGLRIPPAAVWRYKKADLRSCNIFFVALCRAYGFAARLDEATGRPEYRNGNEWVGIDFAQGKEEIVPQGEIILDYRKTEGSPVESPKYYRHFSLSHVIDGIPELCEYDEDAPTKEKYTVDAGYYMLVSGTRLADGSVLSHIEMKNIPSGTTTQMPLILRESGDKVQVMGSIDAEEKFLRSGEREQSSILSATGRGYFLICLMGTHDEPTIHAKGQLSEMAQTINEWGHPVLVLGGAQPEGLANVIAGEDPENKIFNMIQGGIENGEKLALPVIVAADSFGRVLYVSQGYNTSLETQLSSVLKQLN